MTRPRLLSEPQVSSGNVVQAFRVLRGGQDYIVDRRRDRAEHRSRALQPKAADRNREVSTVDTFAADVCDRDELAAVQPERDQHVGAQLVIGHRSGVVRAWVTRYLQAPEQDWSYPAYDCYEPDRRSGLLTDADLLAPVLLNVSHLTLSAYYWLQEQVPGLNKVLVRLDDVPLAEADDATIARLGKLFAVLDGRERRGVRMTILSKVLHRKRPALIPLYDENVEACYFSGPQPIFARSSTRTHEEFTPLFAAVQADLRRETAFWDELAGLASSITPLRALDIVAWGVGGRHVPTIDTPAAVEARSAVANL